MKGVDERSDWSNQLHAAMMCPRTLRGAKWGENAYMSEYDKC